MVVIPRLAVVGLVAWGLVACGGGDDKQAEEPLVVSAPAEKDSSNAKKKGDTDATDVTPSDADDSTTTPPAAPVTATSANGTCQTAKDLGKMAGDADASSVTGVGQCTTWYKLRVEETDSFSLTAETFHAVLTSPMDTKFELHVYVNTAKDETECKTELVKSDTPTGRVDTVDPSWGDSWFSDDSRTAMIEVRSHTGTCATGKYSLEITRQKP